MNKYLGALVATIIILVLLGGLITLIFWLVKHYPLIVLGMIVFFIGIVLFKGFLDIL